jgi:hypothetical protein
MTSYKDRRESRAHQIIFLAEQDGLVEQEFKARLVESFERNDGVSAAYLALVAYSAGATPDVALCLCLTGKNEMQTIEMVQTVFASIFGGDTHLDIIPIVPRQEHELSRVCRAFYDCR